MDRFTSMQVFVKVADLGSFAAAANELKLSPAMVAKHIRTLEERLQVTLIRRTTRRQSLTDVGLSFLERCRSILSEVEAAENLAAESQSAPRGLLRVNAPMTFGSTSLARALPDYLRAHPDVSVELTITDRMVDLVDEGFDAVIRIGELADTSLRALAMTPYEMALCAAPAYLAAHPAPRRPADLANHACLGFAHWAPRNQWSFEGPDKTTETVEVHGPLTVNIGHALRMAALAGLGIILQPRILLQDDIDAGLLVSLLPDWRHAARPMHILTAPDRRRTRKLASFVEFIAQRFPLRGQ
ncbi:LysR family transcriptional regulator [Shinella daejeonensis]|uniref:LysR family transcriptional regulator n=1 Tax=Shinella daejeonensis TaxID=659017 RepID=UPI0020C74BE8|nr:LysR family transcriptional regulator [Shinella daejeonensis]MCP8896303.1 LysR family transcriptional regulator [Shinella daejeonensis]